MARRVANMHELRDRALLVQHRLQEVEGAVFKHQGFHPRKVRVRAAGRSYYRYEGIRARK